MGCCCTVVVIGLLTLVAYVVKKFYSFLNDVPEVPYVEDDYAWGPQGSQAGDVSVKPFKINVPEKDLDDLKLRLSTTRPFTQPLEDINHEYGFNTNLLTEIKDFWQTKYDWRQRETFLNQYPQFTTKIHGLNIHFLHVKPSTTTNLKVVPLILLHGWPGSVREFYECIPKLVEPCEGRNFVFEVVVPHLPGFGFSEGAARPGLNPTRIAVIVKKLMERLEFDRWYVQGGDWGSEIGTQMAILFPKNVLGLHVNVTYTQTPKTVLKRLLGCLYPGFVVSDQHKDKLYPLKNEFLYILRESGYLHLQATRPDTVGVSLNNSPMGLAAYILEKFIVWTNSNYKSQPDGGLALKFGYEKLLDNVMIYWISNSITTSMRLYSETFNLSNPFKVMSKIPVKVPSGYAYFGNDASYSPETILKDKYEKLLHFSELPTGGHFAAFEEPELFAGDVWNAVETFENYHK